MRLLIAFILVLTATASASAECVRVWVPGCWSAGATPTWVPGRYEERVVTTTTTTTTTTYGTPPPPPQMVWVPERWEWNGQAWEQRPGYWAPSGPPAAPPATTTTQVIEVRRSDPPPPRVSVGIGFGYVGGPGYYRGHRGYRGDDCGSRSSSIDVRPPPPLPGSHALPRPPRWVPDPLGVFRHDPLHILRK